MLIDIDSTEINNFNKIRNWDCITNVTIIHSVFVIQKKTFSWLRTLIYSLNQIQCLVV